MNVGDLIEVTVNQVHESHVLVEYNRNVSTLQIPEITWDAGKIEVNDYLKVGEKITVRVIAVEGDRFSTSLKQVSENPWFKHPKLGIEFEAPIVSIAEYGYFFKIYDHCHGLLLRENASKRYSIGEKINVRVRMMDTERQRCELEEC